MERVTLLGVDVSAINMDQALPQMAAWRAERDVIRTYVCVTPAHSLMDCQDDPDLRAIFNAAGMVTPDGMGVVWLLRLLGHRSAGRVYGPDLLRETCIAGSSLGWRHFFLGGTDDVLDALIRTLRSSAPDLVVAGSYAPPFRALGDLELSQMLSKINEADADFVWVALGSPRQERWMHLHRPSLTAPVLIGVGAAFDFLSGNKKQAPRWIQRSGLEWAFRLASEPKRLWPRYRRYPRFVLLAAQAVWTGRRHRRTT